MNRIHLLFFFFVFIITACHNDKPSILSPYAHREASESIVINRGGSETESPYVATVLGNKKINPYSVQIMTQAYNNLSNNDVEKLPVTDLYVRFLPENMNELSALTETGLFLFDYPMDYEIVTQGSYYHDPSIASNKITWLYAVVKPNFSFPNITHEILAELVLAPDNSDLTREAYYLAGLAPNEYVVYRQNLPYDQGANLPCSPEDPGYPNCFGSTNSGGPINPGDPGGGTSTPLNACGCQVPTSATVPSGCIRVEDTQLSPNLRAVREATVIAWNGWFTFEQKKTNTQGHFRMYQDFASPFANSNACPSCNANSNVHIFVAFTNDKADIKCVRQWDIQNYAAAVYDELPTFQNSCNNISVNYMRPANLDDVHTQALRFWMSATTLNAVLEWHDYANAEGILPPPPNTKFLLTPWAIPDYTGSCSMLHKLFGPSLSLLAVPVGAVSTYGTMLTGLFAPKFAPLAALTGSSITGLVGYIGAFPPDIYVGYNWSAGEFTSDIIKETVYHELAHAVHFRRAGHSFWLHEVEYIIQHGGYGDGTAHPGADRAALVEGWGYSIGWMLTDRTYGIHHSLGVGVIGGTLNERRWIYLAERETPCMAGTVNCFNWMMEGLIYDLTDDNGQNPIGVNDPVENGYDVRGVSVQQCFNALDTDVESPQAYRDRLIQNIAPTPGVSADISLLFSDYGYN